MTRSPLPTVQELWPLPLSAADIPEAGTHRDIEADAQTRARVAMGAGLRDVSRLAARFDLKPLAGDRVRVTGTVSATVGQTCVVTLEPIDSTIEEAIDLVFAQDAKEPDPEPESDDPNRHGSWEVDPPEPMMNGAIDLGTIAVEAMILGINPYPRKDGAAITLPEEPSSESHPFAALAQMKGKTLE